MAEKVHERPLGDILEGLFREQKQDIHLLTKGHLNHNRLWRPPEEATHTPWESSGKEVPLVHEPSRLPAASSLRRRQAAEQVDRMSEAVHNFSVGTSGSLAAGPRPPPKKRPERRVEPAATSPPPPAKPQQRPNTVASYISDEAYVEELRLPELMLPAVGAKSVAAATAPNQGPRPRFPHRTGSPKSLAPLALDGDSTPQLQPQPQPQPQPSAMDPRPGPVPSPGPGPIRHQFVESHLGAITKREQFQRFMDFERNVMRRPEMYERNVLSGRKAVEHLEKKLQEDLMQLDELVRSSGPNFLRLQVYSNIWEELIKVTPTFGEFLAEIKDGYESYLGSLLDAQPQSHSEVLTQQVDSLAGGTPVAPGEVSRAREKVQQLEKEAKELLEENDRLRQNVRDEEEALSNIPVPEPETPTQRAMRTSRTQHDDKPKGIAEQILELHTGILTQMDELQSLRQELKEEYVPASVCQHLDQCVRDTEADVLKVLSTNEYLEKTIQQLETELENMMSKSNTDPDESSLYCANQRASALLNPPNTPH